MKNRVKNRQHVDSQKGFSLTEILVVTLLFSIVLTAGSMVFLAGQNAFSFTAARADLLENARIILQRISFELQGSGRDDNGNMKVTILEGTGFNGTDVLRFSVPLCVCGVSPIDANGNVSRWGAPLLWGQAGCSDDYPVNNLGKVDICHLPPGNPNNMQDISVSVDAVKAHLAHGDYLGNCGSCDTNTYPNRTIEYRMDSNGQLLRQILDTNNAVINSVVFAKYMTDFQVSFKAGQTVVTLTVEMGTKASTNRSVSISSVWDVLLRNSG